MAITRRGARHEVTSLSCQSEIHTTSGSSVIRHDVASFLETEVEFVDRLPRGPRAKFRVVEPLASLEIA